MDAKSKDCRRVMERDELSGSHSHETTADVTVHIWRRDGRFVARGSYQKRRFGVTLGEATSEAGARLRQLLASIEAGTFEPPSVARHFPLAKRPVLRLSLRELINRFLMEKRKLLGKETARSYYERLAPALDVAEIPTNMKRWPQAVSIDREFALELRRLLHQHQTTRNGRPNGTPRPMSAGQIFNVLDCLRSALNWGRRPEVRLLPVEWINPVTADIVGSRPSKDPLRRNPLPIDCKVKLANASDFWQLLHLSISLVLPLRPEEAVGLLVSDVDWKNNWLDFKTRFGGSDFTKGHTSFVLPFPPELCPILQRCVGGRTDGPLLRTRAAYENLNTCPGSASREQIYRLFAERLLVVGDDVTCEQDRKQLFRSILTEFGGLSADQLGIEFKRLRAKANLQGCTLRTLREAATQDMKASDIQFLELRYLTSHTTSDIINDYSGIDPAGEMQKYFRRTQPLLDALAARAKSLGIA